MKKKARHCIVCISYYRPWGVRTASLRKTLKKSIKKFIMKVFFEWLDVLTISQGAAPWLKHNLYEQCWVCYGNMNNLLLGFLFSDHTNFGDFIQLFVKDSWKCTKFWNAFAEISFYLSAFLFGYILFAVVIVVCLI